MVSGHLLEGLADTDQHHSNLGFISRTVGSSLATCTLQASVASMKFGRGPHARIDSKPSPKMASGIVTGCGKGIGLATTACLLRSGDTIVGISRSTTPGILGLRHRFGKQFVFIECDISDHSTFEAALKEASSKLPTVNFAVGNAGIRSRMSIENASIDLYREVLEVNTISQIKMAHVLIKLAIERQDPLNLLFLTSIVGPRGFSDLSTYACSKSGLEGFVRSAAVEYAKHQIQINCLAPGFIKSSYHKNFVTNQSALHQWTLERTPMGRWGTCSEVAHLIAFLISRRNSYMTGNTIYCDGGWTSA
jgi:2-deoxy-D-gluconate 3-dehydrogenase